MKSENTMPRGTRIEHRIEIAAPPEAVWAVLADVDDWSRWNPLYAEARGGIAPGDRLDLTVVLRGMKPQKAGATVVLSQPGRRLHYQTIGGGGLMRGTRFVHIEPLGADRCAVTNGEVMGGLLGPLAARALGGRIREAITGMNVALKALVEAR